MMSLAAIDCLDVSQFGQQKMTLQKASCATTTCVASVIVVQYSCNHSDCNGSDCGDIITHRFCIELKWHLPQHSARRQCQYFLIC